MATFAQFLSDIAGVKSAGFSTGSVLKAKEAGGEGNVKLEGIAKAFADAQKQVILEQERLMGNKEVANSLMSLDDRFGAYFNNLNDLKIIMGKFIDPKYRMNKDEADRMQQLIRQNDNLVQSIHTASAKDESFRQEFEEIQRDNNFVFRNTGLVQEQQRQLMKKNNQSMTELWSDIGSNIEYLSTDVMQDINTTLIEGVGGPMGSIVARVGIPLFKTFKNKVFDKILQSNQDLEDTMDDLVEEEDMDAVSVQRPDRQVSPIGQVSDDIKSGFSDLEESVEDLADAFVSVNGGDVDATKEEIAQDIQHMLAMDEEDVEETEDFRYNLNEKLEDIEEAILGQESEDGSMLGALAGLKALQMVPFLLKRLLKFTGLLGLGLGALKLFGGGDETEESKAATLGFIEAKKQLALLNPEENKEFLEELEKTESITDEQKRLESQRFVGSQKSLSELIISGLGEDVGGRTQVDYEAVREMGIPFTSRDLLEVARAEGVDLLMGDEVLNEDMRRRDIRRSIRDYEDVEGRGVEDQMREGMDREQFMDAFMEELDSLNEGDIMEDENAAREELERIERDIQQEKDSALLNSTRQEAQGSRATAMGSPMQSNQNRLNDVPIMQDSLGFILANSGRVS